MAFMALVWYVGDKAWTYFGQTLVETFGTFAGWVTLQFYTFVMTIFMDFVKMTLNAWAMVMKFVTTLIPGPVDDAFLNFALWLGSEEGIAVIKITYWLMDQFVVANVVVLLIAQFIVMWPLLGALRVGMIVLSRFWGSSG
jgi:hypothetical protein